MATSGVMDPTLQGQNQQLIRRSSGRRKAKGGGESKKQKQPRRGMGVAKLERLSELERLAELERLRLQETDPRQLLEMNINPPPSSAQWYTHDFGPNRKPVSFTGFYGLSGSDQLRLLQNHEPDFFPKKSIDDDAIKCFSLHCNACHKKKKINGDHRRFLGLDLDLAPKAPGNYGNKVEVVAVHRKGSAASCYGGNGGVLMEYDFFPSANIDGGGEEGEGEEEGMMKQEVVGVSGFDGVDLSLKLSSY